MIPLSDEAVIAVLERLPVGVIVVEREHTVRYANAAVQRFLYLQGILPGRRLPETPSDPSLDYLVDRLFTAGFLRGEAMTTGDRTFSVEGVVDRKTGHATLVVDDVSARTRRARSEEDFVVNASHEILGPIAAIAGAVQVLQDGAKEDRVARDRFLAHIADASERLAMTATALLVLARAEAGLGGPRLELVSLRPVLDDAGRGKDDVRVVSCAPSLAVLADADLLRQAVGTLVENARRHAASGVEINVEETGEMVAVNIVDDGGGILPENLERVTDRFVTAGGNSRSYGVGLSIAARAANVLGGTLDLSSDRAGTRARLQLPSARLVV